MQRKRIVIVSPASASDNNGNWQTASRWARFLGSDYKAEVAGAWPLDEPAPPDLLVALHARRSAQSLAAFARACPGRPSVLVLTGTDLYRDIRSVPEAQASLAHASALVVLQPAGLDELPEAMRAKAHVIYQSAPSLQPESRVPHHAEFCMIGHLRPEKDPLTFIRAARMVADARARFVHIGAALDPALGAAASAAENEDPRYRWLGPLPHAQARQRLKRCRAMVISSNMEGGANVIIEAVTSGVPVLASNISGNRGMLGDDYAGYFAPGDAAALASLMERCIADRPFAAQLRRQCAARARLFAPEAERAALLDLVDNLLSGRPRPASN